MKSPNQTTTNSNAMDRLAIKPMIPLQLSGELFKQVEPLKKKYNLMFKVGHLSIKEFIDEYNKLKEVSKRPDLSEKDITIIEEYKLALMQAFKNYLEAIKLKRAGAEDGEKNFEDLIDNEGVVVPVSKPYAGFIGWLKYTFVLGVTSAAFAIYGFTHAHNAVNLIPFILPPGVSTIICGVVTLVNLVMTYAFISPILKDKIGVGSGKIARALPNAYMDQLKTTEDVNNILCDIHSTRMMNGRDYREYVKLAKLFNRDMEDLQLNVPKYHESRFSRGLKYFLLGVMAFEGFGGAVISAKAAIAAVMSSAFVPALPLLAAVVLFYFSSHYLRDYYTKGDNTSRLLNPVSVLYEKLKNYLSSFKPVTNATFDHNVADKHSADEANRNLLIDKMVQQIKKNPTQFYKYLRSSDPIDPKKKEIVKLAWAKFAGKQQSPIFYQKKKGTSDLAAKKESKYKSIGNKKLNKAS